MRYAVLGSVGQLGRDLVATLEGDVVALQHDQADLTNPQSLLSALSECQPDIVINCAAYNFVDKAEEEPQAAFAVNAVGVAHLASVCRQLDCTLAQVSTDYVFGLDDDRTMPYEEQDLPGPLSNYGISKLAGEHAARSVAKHFVIRSCGLYGLWGQGGKGKNFVETMLRIAAAGNPLRVVNDQTCTPTYTLDLAEAIAALLQTEDYGLYHVTNSDSCTWYEFAGKIFALAGIDVDLTPITTEQFGASASRPRYSVLCCERYEQLVTGSLRSWEEAVSAYLTARREKTAS